MKVKLNNQPLLTTPFYVMGDPGNERDALWWRLHPDKQAALTRPFVNSSDGLRAEYPVVIPS